ncbi:adenosylcobalamin-dependent ribonucleoside-diphosphate reductase [Dialister invisus]|uniref:adenosylcobalamin-dependent ribonucleoside-diphosphate reductase n=1 Tax=Dialister invisus TaxID=218538 RepID=UPI002E798ACA|nr:adenosylcobalamin-dependent ribonucleoside-diphosphate reductase [Dialister invisus]MEE0504574.1 adenosylcobalamin-dependent ribonucleoside-diphosphate reductase [Dialister invisus]
MEHWYDNEISRGILEAKYYHEGETTPQQFIDRVSSIFKGDFCERIKEYITDGDFSPAGRTLYAAGSRGKFKVSMSNCYILPSPEDNLESIFHSNYEIARIFSYGGGIGINISNLRPAGSRVHNVARTSTGAVSFMKIFNTTGEVISQNGRRGAQMVGLNCSHPDIYEFLHIKQNEEKLSSMNISILFTDEFMEAVRDDKEYTLRFHVESTGENIERTIRARDFFREFCETQWDWGDPGALFSDRLNDYHLLAGYDEYQIEITNPCGEFGGNAYNACNLGSINLYNMIDDKFGNAPSLNEEKFKQAVYDGIIALDEIVSYGYETQPLDENRTCIDDWRSLGLGLFGVADALVAMKLAYGSREASAFMENVMKIMLLSALRSSCDRAKMKGTFGRYRREATEKSPIIQMVKELDGGLYEDIQTYGLRNGTLLAIAPTGTISLLMGSFSGGCEPLYKISYERSTHKMEEVNGSFHVYAHSVKDLLRYHHLPLTLTDDEIREKFPWVIESHDVSFMDRVAMQAVMQKYVDNSISSTVNLKNDATPEDIYDIYLAAWESGCKGITVFRDGCRRGNILGVAAKKEEKADGPKPAEGQPVCPECGGKNIRVEGHCAACSDCGWFACSVV